MDDQKVSPQQKFTYEDDTVAPGSSSSSGGANSNSRKSNLKIGMSEGSVMSKNHKPQMKSGSMQYVKEQMIGADGSKKLEKN